MNMIRKIGVAVFFIFCGAGPLPADDLSILGYGLVFWPAAFVYILVLFLLSLFNLRALWKKFRNRAASIRATFTLIWAAAGMVGFPLVLEGNRFRQLKAMTLLAVEIAGSLAVIPALWLLFRCWHKKKGDR